MKKLSLQRKVSLAAVMLSAFAVGSASAGQIAVNPTPQNILITGSADVTLVFTGDGNTTAFTGALEYDTVQFNASAVASNGATCLVNDSFSPTLGRVALGISPGATIPSNTYCTVTFTTSGATEASYPLNWAAAVFGGSAGGDVATPGQLIVAAAPPTVQTITASGNAGGTVTPATQDVASGTSGVVTITPSGGFQVASIGGTCGGSPDVAPPTSATVTYTTNPVGTAGDADHSADCTVTATFQAIPAPIFSSVPAPGSDIACNGPELSDVVRNVVITNDGDLTLNIASCTAGGTHTVDSFPATLAPGASGNLSVTCHVPANGAPAAVDTVTCTHDAAGSPAQYRFSALAQVVPPPIPAPDLVPASSLWSKLMLFGFLAGLGALVISLRRS